jgi:hypothetical protein
MKTGSHRPAWAPAVASLRRPSPGPTARGERRAFQTFALLPPNRRVPRGGARKRRRLTAVAHYRQILREFAPRKQRSLMFDFETYMMHYEAHLILVCGGAASCLTTPMCGASRSRPRFSSTGT